MAEQQIYKNQDPGGCQGTKKQHGGARQWSQIFFTSGSAICLVQMIQGRNVTVQLLYEIIIDFLRTDLVTVSISCPAASLREAEPLNTGVIKVLAMLSRSSLEAWILIL